jgi:hypothetical protein
LLAEEDPVFEKKRSKVLLMAEKETMAAQSSERGGSVYIAFSILEKKI